MINSRSALDLRTFAPGLFSWACVCAACRQCERIGLWVRREIANPAQSLAGSAAASAQSGYGLHRVTNGSVWFFFIVSCIDSTTCFVEWPLTTKPLQSGDFRKSAGSIANFRPALERFRCEKKSASLASLSLFDPVARSSSSHAPP